MTEIFVEKNEEDELPIPHAWRPIFNGIVSAFVRQDYRLVSGISGIENVKPVSTKTAKQIEAYIADYGEELVELPKEAWDTSFYIYYGDHWNVLIDLWTKGEGLSDLVLQVKVLEQNGGYLVNIDLVYVP